MPARMLREQISREEWARHNGVDPTFDRPAADPRRKAKSGHHDSWMQTLLLPDEMEPVLSAIYDQARTSLQETGVNTLYLALGFLEWYEAPASSKPMFAPLLLHAVDLERRIVGGKYRYSVGSVDEDTQINITLSERLHKDFHRRLPELDEDEAPETYFRKVEETIAEMPRWRLRRFAVVGHFAFARLVMFHDLDDANWPDGVGVMPANVLARAQWPATICPPSPRVNLRYRVGAGADDHDHHHAGMLIATTVVMPMVVGRAACAPSFRARSGRSSARGSSAAGTVATGSGDRYDAAQRALPAPARSQRPNERWNWSLTF